MYSKTITFSQAALNTTDVQSGNISMLFTPSGIVGGSMPNYKYPRGMQFKNSTGQAIKIGLIDSDQQLAEYHADNSNFDLVSVANGDSWTINNLFPLPRSKYILVQCPTGSSSAALDVDFIMFV